MPEREPVTEERILAAAVRLADAEGVDALSMRRLGRELGVEAMALYNHVANKDAILDGLVEVVLAEIETPAPDDEWKDAMRRRAASARAVFLSHPWAIGLLESRPQNSSPRRLGYYDAVLGALSRAGFDSRLAMRAFSAIDAYVYGSILQELALAFDDDASLQEVGADLMEQMASSYPHLTAATGDAMADGYDHAEEFMFGLELLIDAFERKRDDN
ncbi:MAG: TetR family transcriptional regulator [Acidimicrobiia bacterium]|nr:TetR family transcriptional regulator [Acidimicrobiia bacterium]NNL98349.1 TetR family transcriptional regulator [Acidimicrobiia bacterium]